MTQKHVIILGCGRSGTSIFGELFQHFPNHSYYSEPPFEQVAQLDYSHPIAMKVPKESPAYPPDPGLSFPLAELEHMIPRPIQLYWQVRHPLDTICSLKVGISRSWGHHPQPPDWRDWLSKPLVVQCAHHWNYLNSVGYQQVAHLVRICRFEAMIQAPAAFARSIASEVGYTSDQAQEAIDSWAIRVQDSNNSNFVEAETSKAYSTNDHKVRVERWRENMSLEEVALVRPIVEETAARMGYEWPVG